MPSFSYNLSARLARTVGSRLNRVWAGRVSKSSSVRRRTASSPAEGLGLHSDPNATAPRSSSIDDDDGPEQQIRLEVERAIKQEEQEDHFAYSFNVREDDRDYGVCADSEDESAEDESEDTLPHSQAASTTQGDLGDMDEPIQSIEVDDETSDNQSASPSLRGGTSRRRRRRSSDEEDEDEYPDENEGPDGKNNEYEDKDDDNYDYEDPPTNLDDYYESEEDFQDEYDVESEDIDWYRVERTRVTGIRYWARDAAKAHKLMTLCGYYSLFPSSWKCDLVDHPYLSGLFATRNEEKKTLIRAESNQFRATRALRNLFELQIRICAYRQDGLHDKMADLIDQELRRYNASVEKDAKLLGSYAYSSPILIIKFPVLQFADVEEDQLQQMVHAEAMRFCRQGVERYRHQWEQRGVEHFPRVMFAFVIIQHTVQIWALDTEIPVEQLNNPYPLRSIDMSRRNDWLNCTLSIAIPIHLSKEALSAHRWNFPALEVDESDVDL
ncbi:hypothetical protein INS49_001037 [Diaporthe citri]|uniref:uncharacterized protein n=1 Tax=Diaporthe citri TaxID=83186 RepID=UPI001C7F2C2D|nr:uncharacterized protein INS49_001037 [Diaporthe citri]KAG6366856.1 hypothetical protein INS49_001037 [Diaporthe citri]